LKIALKLVNNNNVKDMVSSLQKELSKTHSQEFEKNTEYREVLIQSIHQCAVRFPEVAPNVISALMQFLAEGASSAAVDVVAFIKEIAEKFEDLRSVILKNLLVSFNEIKSSKALRGALWIVGEYCQDVETIEDAWKKIRDSIGEIPIVASEQRNLERAQEEQQDSDATDAQRPSAPSALRVLQDGTYATETSVTSALSTHNSSNARPPIRSLLLKGDYFIGTVVAATITKLVLRYETLESDSTKSNSLRAEALLIMTSIIRVGQSQFTYIPIEEDSYDRIMDHIKLLTSSNRNSELEHVLKVETRQAFTQTVLSNAAAAKRRDANDIEVGDDATESASKQVAVDDKIVFRQLIPPTSQGLEDEYERDLTNATGELSSKENFATKLDRIVQLSGFSDSVYCEAIVEVHQYDILLDILLVNQTNETLQNLTVEFATLGNLKVVEKPASFNLAPKATHSLRSSIKVSSTETGVIFGNIVYDLGSGNSNCVVLNDIHADIMDYIKPAYCSENQFRSMWTEFEWENKVSVTTPIGSLSEFLGQILKATNMATLTPQKALSGDCGFLSTNLYARTIFGEDALANLSIEKQDDGPITGHVRIRSKAQGLALSLGDRITLAQKEIASNAPQVPEAPLITVA
jgi:coatomer subunit beta